MPFNAETYRMNCHRKQAVAGIAAAREIKARAAVGEAYDWEMPRVARFVRIARCDWHMFLAMRRTR